MRKPKGIKITSRSSSITNAFIQAIIPVRTWTEAEMDGALAIFGQERPRLFCVYCGDKASDWDHLRPLVRNKMPTGYIHELRNYVPSCNTCNQSKGGSDWEVWFRSETANSPTRRRVTELDLKLQRLKLYVDWGKVTPLILSKLCDENSLDAYFDVLKEIQDDLVKAQLLASELQRTIQKSLNAVSEA